MAKNYVFYLLCFSLLACHKQGKAKQKTPIDHDPFDFNGIVMDVPDSIIQKYQNSEKDIIFDEYDAINSDKFHPPFFYKNCYQRVGIEFEGFSNECICLEIDNEEIFRTDQKIQWPVITSTQDEFSLAVSVLTPKGKILLQKRTYHSHEPPLPSPEISVNRHTTKEQTIHLKDSLFLWIKPHLDFRAKYPQDARYYISKASVYLKFKDKNEIERIGGADLREREVKYREGINVPIPKKLWDKNTEYLLLKVNGIYRKNSKDSVFPIYGCDSIFKFYPKK